jgi:hypothetical protein
MPVIFRTGGGGAALNFKVKSYSALPESGSENEIAVITNTPMTGYVLQAEEPIGAEGSVWIQLGALSIAPVWIDKKHTVRVYPIAMKQYESGAWETKPSHVYQNGEWVDFGWLFLYQEGDEREALTGGWTGDSVTLNSNSIKFGGNVPANTNWYCRTENLVSVKNKKTLVFDLDVSKLGNTSIISTLRVGLSTSAKPSTTTSNYAAYMNIPVASYGTLDRQELEIDVTELNGDYYPIIYIRNGNASTAQDAVINIYNVYLK